MASFLRCVKIKLSLFFFDQYLKQGNFKELVFVFICYLKFILLYYFFGTYDEFVYEINVRTYFYCIWGKKILNNIKEQLFEILEIFSPITVKQFKFTGFYMLFIERNLLLIVKYCYLLFWMPQLLDVRDVKKFCLIYIGSLHTLWFYFFRM